MAVRLAEGPAGVTDVLRVIARHEPVASKEIARRTELPVPIVAAVCSELRKRGVVDRTRPARLTAAGRAGMAALGGADTGRITGRCPCCQGNGATIPDALAGVLPALERIAAEMPAAKLDLDQTHCTADTKLRRVLRMHEAGALAGQRVLMLGDDDMVSVALAAVAAELGPGFRPRRLAVVDCDRDLLGHLGGVLDGLGLPADVVEHDLREPLPGPLAGAFDAVSTDPPYTVAGAELFLSRAVTALAGGGAGYIFLSYGARRPEETLATQRLMAAMGLTVRSLVPGFNTYTGAGILGGTSHLYELRATAGSQAMITGAYRGPLYSAASRAVPARPYRCALCGAIHPVGPGARWPRIADLKMAGCPDCGGTVFRPQPLARR